MRASSIELWDPSFHAGHDDTAQGLVVTIGRSKTDEEGQGEILGIPYGQRVATCHVLAVRGWLDRADIRAGDLFRRIDRWGNISEDLISAHYIARIVK